MSLSVGSNSNIIDVFKHRRNALQAMETAVQAGSIDNAQQSLLQLAQDSQTIQSLLGNRSATSGGQSFNSDNNPYRVTIKSDLTNLVSSVSSGDLSGAQQALLQFQQDQQGFESRDTDARASADPQRNSQTRSAAGVIADFKALLRAALSGDAQGAQNAATSPTNDLQNNLAVQGATTAQALTPATTTASSGSSSNNSFLDNLRALIDAAQSGDQNGARQAAQQLTLDIQNTVGGTNGPRARHHHHHDDRGGANANNLLSTVVPSTSSSPVGTSTDGMSSTPGTSTSDPQNSTTA